MAHVLLLGQRSKRDGPLLLSQGVSHGCLKFIEVPQMTLVYVVFQNILHSGNRLQLKLSWSGRGTQTLKQTSDRWVKKLVVSDGILQVRDAVQHPLGYLEANPKPQRGYRVFRTLKTIYF